MKKHLRNWLGLFCFALLACLWGAAPLQAAGNTVLVIEHNLDVIKSADWLIDLGPEGGSGGGTLVCAGTPETVAACPQSYTGQYLKKYLK